MKMWFACLLLSLAVAVGEGTETDSPTTIEEVLLKRRCVPTAVTRGPCHVCSCSSKGAYQCRSNSCAYEERDNSSPSSQPECEPDMLYNEGALWCLCDERGFWRSTNCRSNFRSMRHKFVARQGPVFNKNIPCENGSFYAVDCNVCECRGDNLTANACTNRTCPAGGKADQCKQGQLVRTGLQLCACSVKGYYDDKHCIDMLPKIAIQRIAPEDIAKLNAEKTVTLNTICEPSSVIQRDCNHCTCTPSGNLACTSKLCLSNLPDAQGNVSVDIERSLNRYTRQNLPQLQSDKDPCEPGKQYRYKCNTCICTNKRLPACTTMICLDFFGKDMPKKEVVRDSGKKDHGVYHLPEIHEGELCYPGLTYRLDCNVCRCNTKSRLVCTKKLCLSAQEISKQHEFEKKMTDKKKEDKKKTGKIYATNNKNMYMEVFDDKLVIHQRTGKKKNARSGPRNSSTLTNDEIYKEKSVDSKVEENDNVTSNANNIKKNANNEHETVNKENIKENSEDKDKSEETLRNTVYPPLPTTKKCQPGHIYSKGCQRCFCNIKQIGQCTNRPCEEMKGDVTLPKDVFPRISSEQIKNLPTLPHEAARCKPGKVYLVECNVCLCLFNGNLFCQNKLCLAMNEVNKLAALRMNGKSCAIKEGKAPKVKEDCVKCSCVQAKFRCEPLENCTPFRFRRQLHGDLNPKVSTDLSLDAGAKCSPGMVYKQSCNNCYCQDDGSLRCTRKGCLNYQQVEKLKKQRQRLLKIDS